ncbi:hypothetical protein CL634_07485 [bacterium]|nr:hypothetical protein [bacterium]
MLPKRLSKKKQPLVGGQQLKLEDTVSSQSRLKKKRTLLLFVFGFTAGLSVLFSLYRFITSTIPHLNFSFPTINTPTFNVSKSANVDLDKELTPLLSPSDSWSIYVKTLSSPSFSWSLNSDPYDIDTSLSQLSSLSASSSGLIQGILPQGVLFQENLDLQNELFEYQTLISIPGQQIFISINGPDQKIIPQLVEIIYWQVIKNI